MKKRRINHETDSGVFADVSFLLLIFFMVVTTFNKAYELQMNLPPASINQKSGKISKQRLLNIHLNDKSQILIEGIIYNQDGPYSLVEEIQRITAHTKPGLVKINMLASTPYKGYIHFLTRLKKDKEIVVKQMAKDLFAKDFSGLSHKQKQQILSKVKYSIVEKEILEL